MTEKQIMTKKLNSYGFAIYDLRLFMDTHPTDTSTQSIIDGLEKEYNKIKDKYVEKYGPLTFSQDTAVQWVKNPWPWEG